jgi:putative toxin-antitoxin system antitoxin component (TIGR02293 family)
MTDAESLQEVVLNFFAGDNQKASRWLSTPAAAFDGKTPREMLEQPAGHDIVMSLIGRVEYGVYS